MPHLAATTDEQDFVVQEPLGGDTRVGANSIIGSNVWLMRSIPDDSVAYFKGDNLVVRSRAKKDVLVGNTLPITDNHNWEI